MVIIEDNKINPSKKIIDDLNIQIIYIPLESKLGYTYDPVVKIGDYICIGSILGNSISTEIPLLSTVSGYLVGFKDMYISNGKKVNCLVIENDFKERYIDKLGKKKDISKCSKKEFLYKLMYYGIVGRGGSGFPTYLKYSVDKDINYLIINATECEIGPSCDSSLLYNYPEEILECIDAIMEIMNIKKSYIAIKENNNKIIKKLLKYINTYPNIKIYPIIDAYPCGYERNLVSTILNLNYDKYPIEVSTIVNNVATIYSIYEILKYQKPSINRVVTISGTGFKNKGNYKVRIGTNFNEIVLKTDGYIKNEDLILIAGGKMMGNTIPSDELVITPDINCILVEKNITEVSSKCINCGKCSEVCPRGLIPSLIINNPDKSRELMIDKCIGCGLCSYICPAKLEIKDKINLIKGSDK